MQQKQAALAERQRLIQEYDNKFARDIVNESQLQSAKSQISKD